MLASDVCIEYLTNTTKDFHTAKSETAHLSYFEIKIQTVLE